MGWIILSKFNLQQRFRDVVSNHTVGNILKFNSSGVLTSVSLDSVSSYAKILPQIVIRVTNSSSSYLTPSTITSVKVYLVGTTQYEATYTILNYENPAWVIDVPSTGTYTIEVNANNYQKTETIEISEFKRYSTTISTTLT